MPRKFTCSTHIHFRKQFKSTKNLTKFTDEFREYVQVEAKKVAEIKFLQQERLLILSSRRNRILFGLNKEYMDLMISGSDRPDELHRLDEFFNKIYAFVGLSPPSIRLLSVSYSKEFPINSNPIGKYVEKAMLADFNSKSRMFFNPCGLVLGTKSKEKALLVVLAYDQDHERTELDITELWNDVKAEPLDILRKSNESIELQKDQIFAALGVRLK